MAGRILERVGMEDFRRGSREYRVDLGSMPDELVGQLHALDGGNAPGDSEDDRLALELEALEASQALRRVHCVTIAIRDIYLWSRSPEGPIITSPPSNL